MNWIEKLKNIWEFTSFKPDVPLSRDESSRFLPWIIALMVYLTALTLTGSFTLHRSMSEGQDAQVESFSVHLPLQGDKEKEANRALGIVENTPGVRSAEILSTERIEKMVEPWFGSGSALQSLPLPIIIDAKIIPGQAIDFDELKNQLKAITPGVDIDDHKQWIAQFAAFVHMIQWMLAAIAVLIISASAAAVIFTCKTSLKIHRSTVTLLHRLGAYDSYIADQFQHHAALLALKGACIGSAAAAATFLVLHMAAKHIDSPLFPSLVLGLNHWAILVMLPIGMTLIALASARISVLTALSRMS